MPWKEECAVDQRLLFISDVLRGEFSMSELCRRYGVSRTTGYKWRDRYVSLGMEGLQERTSAPQRHPNSTPQAVVDLVLRARKDHPTWGPRKLKARIERQFPGLLVPAASTIGTILKQHGLVKGRRRVRRDRPLSQPRVEVSAPNDCWCFDFKGQFRLGSGAYCFPLTAVDAHSRFFLACKGLDDVRGETTMPVVRELFQEFGLPEAILTDCGAPFASTSFSGLSELSSWWIALGIRVHRSRPGSPQDNGKLERLHKTLKAETTKPSSQDQTAQQGRFDHFRKEYNEIRPHESLAMAVPADVYKPARKRYPRRLKAAHYPTDAIVKMVRKNGTIHYGGFNMTISHVLRGQRVALVPVDDGVMEIRFYDHPIGQLNLRTASLTNGNTTKSLTKKKNPKLPPTLLQAVSKV
jgi:putative transposase